MKITNANTRRRVSILNCPKCGKRMTDLYTRSKRGREHCFDSYCICSYSLSGVKAPTGKLIEKIK